MISKHPSIATARLRLRPWQDSDREPFAALNADPQVYECLLGPLSGEQSDALIERIRGHFDRHGFGLWAVEVPGVVDFIGYVGLQPPVIEAHFTPCVEVGWRLAHAHWGHGYATEAARSALNFGFAQLGLREIVSMTAVQNLRSRRVMERLGMVYDPADDFDHPRLAENHPLRRHVLYRLQRPQPVPG